MNFVPCIPVIGPIIYAAKELYGWYDTRADKNRTIEVIGDRLDPLSHFHDDQVIALVVHVAYLILGFAFARALQWSPLGLALFAVSIGAFLTTGLLFWSSGRRLNYTQVKVLQIFQASVVARYETLKRDNPDLFENRSTLRTAVWNSPSKQKFNEDLGNLLIEFEDKNLPYNVAPIVTKVLRMRAGPLIKKGQKTTSDNIMEVLASNKSREYNACWNLKDAHTGLISATYQSDVATFQRAVTGFEARLKTFQAHDFSSSTSSEVETPAAQATASSSNQSTASSHKTQEA